MRRLGCWLVLCCLLLVGAFPAAAAPSVEMRVQPVNEGRARQGEWTTIVVELANQGGEFSGELVVEAETDMPHPQYVVPFTLPAGGRKRIPVSLESLGGADVSVRLLSDGREVRKERVTFTWLPPQATLVGVLSGDELGIPGLSQLQGGGAGAPQVVRLSADTFPDRASLLEGFDVIALSRFDTSTLSPAQLRALELWVGRGGTLILAGGPEWKRTLSALPPALVPVEVSGVREVPLHPLGDLAGRPLDAAGAVSVATPNRGQTLVRAGDVPLVVRADTGLGQVLYLAFDPGLSPLVGWAGQPALFNQLLGSAVRTAREWPGEWDGMLHLALQNLPEWSLPGLWMVSLLLVSYLLLVGPVNYLVLKRLDRREWGWVSVPAISLLFVAAVYLLNSGRFQPLMTHLITVTELLPGTGGATMTSYLGLYAPGYSRLRVDLGDAQLVRPYTASAGPGSVSARIVAGERTTVELLKLSTYQMSSIVMEHDIAVQGGLELVDGRVEEGVLTGRLRNSLSQPVSDLQVITVAGVAGIGRLEPGQLSEPIRVPLGDGSGGILSPKGISVMPPMPEDPENTPEGRRRELVMNHLLRTVLGRSSGSILIAGWTDEPPADVQVPELGKVVRGANLVYSLVPVPVDEATAEIPAGVILGRPADPAGVELLSDGYLLQPGSHTFTLLLPPLVPERVASVEIDLRMQVGEGGPDTTAGPIDPRRPVPPVVPRQPIAPGDLTISVLNRRTGEWLPITAQRLTLPAWQEFVSPAGLIELRYQASTHVEILPPTVAVKGVGR